MFLFCLVVFAQQWFWAWSFCPLFFMLSNHKLWPLVMLVLETEVLYWRLFDTVLWSPSAGPKYKFETGTWNEMNSFILVVHSTEWTPVVLHHVMFLHNITLSFMCFVHLLFYGWNNKLRVIWLNNTFDEWSCLRHAMASCTFTCDFLTFVIVTGLRNTTSNLKHSTSLGLRLCCKCPASMTLCDYPVC